MKQTILLIALLVSTLGMASEFKGPYETMSGISQEELDMIKSVSRDQRLFKMTKIESPKQAYIELRIIDFEKLNVKRPNIKDFSMYYSKLLSKPTLEKGLSSEYIKFEHPDEGSYRNPLKQKEAQD